jgi:hypothetical protein
LNKSRREPADQRQYRQLWDNIKQHSNEEAFPPSEKQQYERNLEEIREQARRIASQIEMIKSAQDQGRLQAGIKDEEEQQQFQDREFFDNFCSRNVIRRMKSEGQKNTLLLRLILGTTGNAGRKLR